MSGKSKKESAVNGDSDNEETLAALELLGAQINAALLDLADPQRDITTFFNQMLHDIDGLVSWIDAAEEESLELISARASLTNIKNGATQSVLQFQAFDRVEQRLRHVIDNLHLISDLADKTPDGLLDLIGTTYSLEHEHILLKLVRLGAAREDLMEPIAIASPQQDDSELF